MAPRASSARSARKSYPKGVRRYPSTPERRGAPVSRAATPSGSARCRRAWSVVHGTTRQHHQHARCMTTCVLTFLLKPQAHARHPFLMPRPPWRLQMDVQPCIMQICRWLAACLNDRLDSVLLVPLPVGCRMISKGKQKGSKLEPRDAVDERGWDEVMLHSTMTAVSSRSTWHQ